MKRTIHVSIGNSDDKLSQSRWSMFCSLVDRAINDNCEEIHGRFYSPSSARYQNACWAFTLPDMSGRGTLMTILSQLAEQFDQESIAWNESETKFIAATKS